GIDLNNRDLRGLNFSGFNLVNANFSGSDIYQCSFRKANMTGALFVKTRIENTDLTGITLTGACIEDWVVTKTTKLQELIDHPLVNILLATLEGWQDTE
ncbi:pentapeptide repeat-containing protein, partial [Nostoc sp.]